MQQLASAVYDPWPDRRRRTGELLQRYPFSAEMLTFFGALLPVQERAFRTARSEPPSPAELASWVAGRTLPDVVDVTAKAGPRKLAQAAAERFVVVEPDDLIASWLRGEEQAPVEQYLARASAGPVLEAMGDAAGLACEGPQDDRHCPTCGGLPQLSYFGVTNEALVTGPRYLLCSRCGNTWTYARMVCASCGENSSQKLAVYGEAEHLPHVRIDGCESCHRYLLTFDLRKDTRSVPIVDELAALPLDLYAQEQGMTKIVPNLMGF